MRPHRRQPTKPPHSWDSPVKNTGVGCHFLLQWMKVKRESEVAQSCLTLSDPMDCSLPGSSVHGINILPHCKLCFHTSPPEIESKEKREQKKNCILAPRESIGKSRSCFDYKTPYWALIDRNGVNYLGNNVRDRKTWEGLRKLRTNRKVPQRKEPSATYLDNSSNSSK